MALVLGLNGVLHRNTGAVGGGFAAATWVAMSNVTNVTLNTNKALADVTTRGGSGWRQQVGTLKEGTVDFEMIYDTADADFTAMQAAFLNNTQLEFYIADGASGTSGSQGLFALFDVTDFSIDQQLEDAFRVTVQLTVSFGSTPSWETVP